MSNQLPFKIPLPHSTLHILIAIFLVEALCHVALFALALLTAFLNS